MTEPIVKFQISFADPQLDEDEREEEAQKLLSQMKDMDEIESVRRVVDHNPPQGNKSIGGVLVGLLLAEVNLSNTKKLILFLSDRLSGKTIELEVEANGKSLKIKASSREELAAALETAQKFIQA